jgi:hypothetical protein
MKFGNYEMLIGSDKGTEPCECAKSLPARAAKQKRSMQNKKKRRGENTTRKRPTFSSQDDSIHPSIQQ